jgi:hypothetical protein
MRPKSEAFGLLQGFGADRPGERMSLWAQLGYLIWRHLIKGIKQDSFWCPPLGLCKLIKNGVSCNRGT